MSRRHVLPMLAPLLVWAAIGVQLVARAAHRRWPSASARNTIAFILILTFGVWPFADRRSDKAHTLTFGAFIAAEMPQRHFVLTDERLVAYAAGWPFLEFANTDPNNLASALRVTEASVIVIDAQDFTRTPPERAERMAKIVSQLRADAGWGIDPAAFARIDYLRTASGWQRGAPGSATRDGDYVVFQLRRADPQSRPNPWE
jgi:hypothetical protein